MEISVVNQANIFLFSAMGGAIIAFIYDIFRIKRKTIRTTRLGVFIEDFIFWILVSLVMFAVVYYSNEGEVRGYIFLGACIGVILYTLLLSRLIMKFFLTAIQIFVRIFKAIWFVISYPFKVLIKIISIPYGFMLKATRNTVKKARRAGKTQFSKLYIWKRMFKNIIKKI